MSSRAICRTGELYLRLQIRFVCAYFCFLAAGVSFFSAFSIASTAVVVVVATSFYFFGAESERLKQFYGGVVALGKIRRTVYRHIVTSGSLVVVFFVAMEMNGSLRQRTTLLLVVVAELMAIGCAKYYFNVRHKIFFGSL